MSRRPKNKDKLNEQQKRFCSEYLIDFNGMQAAIRAGYAKKAAGVQATRLLKLEKVQLEIKRLLERRRDKCEIEAEDIIAETAAVAFSDLRAVVSWNAGGVNMRDSEAISADASRSIQSVTSRDTKYGTTVSVKLHDKLRALELLAKLLGITGDDPQALPQTVIVLPDNGR